MAKQNPREPRFRCNVCKEYHEVPEYKVMYQCPIHGYLCENHIINENTSLKIKFHRGNKWIERTAVFPETLYDFCNIEMSTSEVKFNEIRYGEKTYKRQHIDLDNFIWYDKDVYEKIRKHEIDREEYLDSLWKLSDRELIEKYFNFKDGQSKSGNCGCKKTIKWNWVEEKNMWIEDGAEIKRNTTKISTNKNSEILLLLDLFEKNILSKEQFIEQIRTKF